MNEILGLRDFDPTPDSPEKEADIEGDLDSQIEEVAEERSGLLYNFLTSRLVDKVGNAIPVANIFKQVPEIIAGQTTSGREIETGRQKFVHAIEMVAVNAAWAIIYNHYHSGAGGEILGAVPFLKAASNINNTKEALMLSKETVLAIFGTVKYMATDEEFHKLAVAAIAALPVDVFSNEVVELNLRNA
jgi:hypothetical protein